MDCWVYISPIQSLGGLHEIHVIPWGEILNGSLKWRYTKKKVKVQVWANPIYAVVTLL
jgi:hypothetical protein